MKTRTLNILNKNNLNINLEEELKTKTIFDLLKIKGIGPATILDWASPLNCEEQSKVQWSVYNYRDAIRLKYELIKAKREYKHRKFMFIKYGIKTKNLIEIVELTKEAIQSFCEDYPELKYMFEL